MATGTISDFQSLYASRLHTRSSLDLRARVVTMPTQGNPLIVYGRTRNLSRSGVAVTLTGELPAGSEVLFCLRMPASGEALCLRSVVARRHGSLAGLHFLEPTLGQRRQISMLCDS